MFGRNKIFYLLISVLVFLSGGFSGIPAAAQAYSAADLINAVNVFRADYDLPAYEMDSSLMAIAQEHSEYQASIETLTHERADGSGPGDHGISSENIGGGAGVSPDYLIYSQWTDYWHTHTLIGYQTGLVGAGVAVGNNGITYYTLVVKNTGGQTGLPAAGTQTTGTAAATQAATASGTEEIVVITSTPGADNAIVHIVQLGETLWHISMAYEISVDDLIALNALDADNPLIYEGDAIIIHLPNTPTVTATITNTPLPPTRTLRPSRTPLPTRTLKPDTGAETPTPAHPLVPENTLVNTENLQKLGLAIIIITFLGLAFIIFSWFWKNKRPEG